MLVLTRKSHQEIIIGDNIRLTILDIRGGRVKVGVVAPEDVNVFRKEIADRERPVCIEALALGEGI